MSKTKDRVIVNGEFREFPEKEIDRAKRLGRLNSEPEKEKKPETIRRKKNK